MSLDLNAIDAALHNALPILASTVYPVLAITAGVSLWLRGQDVDDDYNVDDYLPPTVARAAVYRYQPAADDRTQVIARILPDGGTPLYDQMSAKQKADRWLREIADTHAYVNGVNEGSRP